MTDHYDRTRYQLLTAGAQPSNARGAMILLHGRGATATDILQLHRSFGQADIAYLAPQAPGYQWYPHRFMEPIPSNEPYLTHALQAVDDLVTMLEGQGIERERIVLLGFSQGACLATEYAARHARRYGGVVGLSGGLIGPDGTPRDYPGSLDGTPVFLGCSDTDAHIPLRRVQETTRVLTALGGDVTERIYPGMGHTVNEDEIEHVNRMLDRLGA
jgi:predicted esterase